MFIYFLNFNVHTMLQKKDL